MSLHMLHINIASSNELHLPGVLIVGMLLSCTRLLGIACCRNLMPCMTWMETQDQSCKPFAMFSNSTCMSGIANIIGISSDTATAIGSTMTEFDAACQAQASKVRSQLAGFELCTGLVRMVFC
jgi:hypothetical protein